MTKVSIEANYTDKFHIAMGMMAKEIDGVEVRATEGGSKVTVTVGAPYNKKVEFSVEDMMDQAYKLVKEGTPLETDFKPSGTTRPTGF